MADTGTLYRRRLAMTLEFTDYLNQTRADRDTLQQALRYYLAEQTGDLTPEEMLQQVLAVAGDAGKVNQMLRDLADSSQQVENVSLALLSVAWTDPSKIEQVK